MITIINEVNKFTKHFSYNSKCKFNSRKCNSNQKQNIDIGQCECKKPIKNCVCKTDFAWIPSTCPCQCVKHCDINKYLKHCSCVKTIVDDLVITCDEIIDEPRTALINSNDKKAKHKINYYHTSILSKV